MSPRSRALALSGVAMAAWAVVNCGGDGAGRSTDTEASGGQAGALGGTGGTASGGAAGRAGAGGAAGSGNAGSSGGAGVGGQVQVDAGTPAGNGSGAGAGGSVDASASGPAGAGGTAELPRDLDGDFERKGVTIGADGREQPGVPKGKITAGSFTSATVYAGNKYAYSIYVPAQYDGAKPAALMVWQDGDYPVDTKGLYRIPTIFDNLIAKGDVPVTVHVFVSPSSSANRGLEYDSVDDRYVKFLVDELIPFVTKTHTLSITDNPEGHAIGGHSSGAVAAFVAGWQRPDYFRRIHTANGSFVGIRGADKLAGLVRTTKPVKPLRVFLTSGPGDIEHATYGSWFESNKTMAAALKEAGYHYRFCWGAGGHFPPSMAGSLMAETMRWLWHGYAP